MEIVSLLLIAGSATSFLTYGISKFAYHFHLVDKPRSDRFHTRSTALMGGCALLLGIGATWILYSGTLPIVSLASLLATLIPLIWLVCKQLKAYRWSIFAILLVEAIVIYFGDWSTGTHSWLWFAFGAHVLFFAGLTDDLDRHLPARAKLLIQIGVSALFAFQNGHISFLPYWLSLPFTIAWMVALMNAFNLIDNMNGLSSGIAAIAALFMAGLAFEMQALSWHIIALIIAGSLLGYLPHNYPKARIFMGDSGSLVLGYVLGGMSLQLFWNSEQINIEIGWPLVLLAYPLFDVAFVVINRIREGRPVYIGGKDHTSHRLVQKGFSPAWAVALIFSFAICLNVLFFYLIYEADSILATIMTFVVLVVGALIGYWLTMPPQQFPKSKKNIIVNSH